MPTTKARFQFRGGTAAEWTSADSVLLAREIGIVTDQNAIFFGDGVTAYSSLPKYPADLTSVNLTLNGNVTFGGTLDFDGATFQLPAAKLADNAVSTSKIASLAVSTSKIASLAVTEGKIANGVVTAAKLADGVVTRGLEFIESQDAASSATLDFTGFDDTKYDSYLFVLANIIPATTGDDNLRLRTSTDGGATYDNTLGDYHYSSQQLPMSATPMGGVNGASSATAITLALNVGGNTNEDGFSGEVSILGPHLAKVTAVQWQGSYRHGTTFHQWSSGAGIRDASEAVDAARFFFFDNSIASGTITMYGRSNGA